MNDSHDKRVKKSRLLKTLREGFWVLTHNGLAMLGFGVLCLSLLVSTQPEWRGVVQGWASDLVAWGDGGTDPELSALDRVTAESVEELPQPQAAATLWLAKRYRIAPEPLAALVREAWSLGHKLNVEPTLLLAVMAIESGFNPYAQSRMGAQGLMQVMTRVHDEKYDPFGGEWAAFDPLSNLRVGGEVLKDCISKKGSIEGGLICYVGATSKNNDGGYSDKVLAEQSYIRDVVQGKRVATSVGRNSPGKVNKLADSGSEDKARLLLEQMTRLF